MVLRAEGFPASAADLVDTYLPTDPTWEDYVDRFAGDPRGQGGAMPPAMMACTRSFLAANGDMLAGASGSARPVDLTGAGFDEVRGYVERGYPVMTWVTLDLTAPRFTGREVRGYRWYRNLHCVVLHGFDGGDAIVADPIAGPVRHDASGFREVFEACGAMAMTVLP